MMRKTGLMTLREGKEGELSRAVYAGRTHKNVSESTGINKQTLSKMLTPGLPFRGTTNLNKLFALLVPNGEVDKQSWINKMIRSYYIPVEREEEPKPAVWRNTPDLSCVTVYIKVLHLRDRSNGSPPVYRRTIHRANGTFEVDVYDEVLLLRTNHYKSPVKNRLITDSWHAGGVDVLPILPARVKRLTHSSGQDDSLEIFEFIEQIESDLTQTSFFIFNEFQREEPKNGYVVGSDILEDCERIVLVVDMTSLPIPPQDLFTEPPCAYYLRADLSSFIIFKMSCKESLPGSFIIDSNVSGKNSDDEAVQDPEPEWDDATSWRETYVDSEAVWDPERNRPRLHDRIELQFRINWDAVNKQQG